MAGKPYAAAHGGVPQPGDSQHAYGARRQARNNYGDVNNYGDFDGPAHVLRVLRCELHPSAETLDLSDRALVVSFQTISSWRSSASNSTGGL